MLTKETIRTVTLKYDEKGNIIESKEETITKEYSNDLNSSNPWIVPLKSPINPSPSPNWWEINKVTCDNMGAEVCLPSEIGTLGTGIITVSNQMDVNSQMAIDEIIGNVLKKLSECE